MRCAKALEDEGGSAKMENVELAKALKDEGGSAEMENIELDKRR